MSLLWLFAVLVLSVFLHEVGHAVAAWAGGYQVTSFGIGSGKPILRARLRRSGTLFYLCRFGLRFSGITWVFSPKGTPSRISDLMLACGGALANAVVAFGAARALALFELRSVPFLSVWVPTVVVLLVNSVLALLFFVPHRTLSAEQGTLTSDGLRVLAILFPTRFRGRQLVSIAAPLRTLSQKRLFWESIGDTTIVCVALIRAAEAYGELDDYTAVRLCWEELSRLAVVPSATLYQRAWGRLMAVRLGEADNVDTALADSERDFHAIGNRTGALMVTRERMRHQTPQQSPSDRDASLTSLQAEALALGDARLALAILADRIDLQAVLLLRGRQNEEESFSRSVLTILERLASQYDAARLELDSSIFDVRVYGQIAAVRASIRDDGGAAVAYERALSTARGIFVALAFMPEAQGRFAIRQAPLVSAAMDCCRRLGRAADAARYADLLT